MIVIVVVVIIIVVVVIVMVIVIVVAVISRVVRQKGYHSRQDRERHAIDTQYKSLKSLLST